MACDSKERALIAALRAGQTQFVRIEAVGPIIEGAIPYRYRQDFVAFITDVDKGQNLGSVYVRKVKFALGRDLSTGNAMACRVINTRTAL
jgi:predicted RNA-binding protein with TRAM domain